MAINLPGSFRIYPNGKKPKSFAPHAQHSLTPYQPIDHPHHNIEPAQAAQRQPRHNIQEARRPDPTPRHNIREGWRADPSPRHNIEPFQPPDRAPRHQISAFKRPSPAPRHQIREPQKSPVVDPFGNHHFALELNGVEVAHFMECSGLKSSNGLFEFQEGGLNSMTHRRPGANKWENLVLKYGSSPNMDLLKWRDSYLMGNFSQRVGSGKISTGKISLKDNRGKVVRSYEFSGAWPVSWEGPALSAGGSALAIETLEIAHDGLKVVDPS